MPAINAIAISAISCKQSNRIHAMQSMQSQYVNAIHGIYCHSGLQIARALHANTETGVCAERMRIAICAPL
eukprot:3976772-Lingulodinium_polyedra.AAC.1